MSEISLVTAFFNIGRENFKAIPRSNDVYLSYFRFWARIKNQLVVYTDKYTAKDVMEIRREFGLENRTKVDVIDDISTIEPDILEKMNKVKDSAWFERFRILPNATSNIPQYSYLMLLKTWFLDDAVNKGYVKGIIAWIDFGFNHGGTLYTNPEDFSFLWDYEFSDKIHLFYYKLLDKKPTYEMVRRLCDSIMGCIYVLPDHYCHDLWQLTKHAMENLLAVGLYDDDQMLLLMAYREKSDIFEMHESDWFLPLKEYGNQNLSVRKTVPKPAIKRALVQLKKKAHRIRLALRNAYFTFVDLSFKD